MSFDERAFRREIGYLPKRIAWNLPEVIKVELARAIAQHQPAAVIATLTRKLEIARDVLEARSRNLPAMGGRIKAYRKRAKSGRGLPRHQVVKAKVSKSIPQRI